MPQQLHKIITPTLCAQLLSQGGKVIVTPDPYQESWVVAHLHAHDVDYLYFCNRNDEKAVVNKLSRKDEESDPKYVFTCNDNPTPENMEMFYTGAMELAGYTSCDVILNIRSKDHGSVDLWEDKLTIPLLIPKGETVDSVFHSEALEDIQAAISRATSKINP